MRAPLPQVYLHWVHLYGSTVIPALRFGCENGGQRPADTLLQAWVGHAQEEFAAVRASPGCLTRDPATLRQQHAASAAAAVEAAVRATPPSALPAFPSVHVVDPLRLHAVLGLARSSPLVAADARTTTGLGAGPTPAEVSGPAATNGPSPAAIAEAHAQEGSAAAHQLQAAHDAGETSAPVRRRHGGAAREPTASPSPPASTAGKQHRRQAKSEQVMGANTAPSSAATRPPRLERKPSRPRGWKLALEHVPEAPSTPSSPPAPAPSPALPPTPASPPASPGTTRAQGPSAALLLHRLPAQLRVKHSILRAPPVHPEATGRPAPPPSSPQSPPLKLPPLQARKRHESPAQPKHVLQLLSQLQLPVRTSTAATPVPSIAPSTRLPLSLATSDTTAAPPSPTPATTLATPTSPAAASGAAEQHSSDAAGALDPNQRLAQRIQRRIAVVTQKVDATSIVSQVLGSTGTGRPTFQVAAQQKNFVAMCNWSGYNTVGYAANKRVARSNAARAMMSVVHGVFGVDMSTLLRASGRGDEEEDKAGKQA